MNCHLCGHEHTVEFLNLGKQPLANKYPTEAQFAGEEFFALEVFFCLRCKNVQLATIVSRERMFEDYYYLSSVNAGLVRHFEKLAKKLAASSPDPACPARDIWGLGHAFGTGCTGPNLCLSP
jgi:methylation protein EvaC